MSDFHWTPAREGVLLRLQPLSEDDFTTLYQVASDPLIWEQHPERNRFEEPVFRKYFDSGMASGTAYLILDRSNGEIIGSSRYYNIDPVNHSVAIGYTFLIRRCWGGTYNRELKQLMIDHAFQQVNKVIFHVGATNFRSQQGILRTGAVKTGEMEVEEGGSKRINFEFALEKNRWETHRK